MFCDGVEGEDGRLDTAPNVEAILQRRLRALSQLRVIWHQKADALDDTLDMGKALAVQLEDSARRPAIRNCLHRVAETVGAADIVVQRRNDLILAYRPPTETEQGKRSAMEIARFSRALGATEHAHRQRIAS